MTKEEADEIVFNYIKDQMEILNRSFMSDGGTDAWGKRQPIKINLMDEDEDKKEDLFNLDAILDEPIQPTGFKIKDWNPKCVCGGETAKTTGARWCDKWKAEK